MLALPIHPGSVCEGLRVSAGLLSGVGRQPLWRRGDTGAHANGRVSVHPWGVGRALLHLQEVFGALWEPHHGSGWRRSTPGKGGLFGSLIDRPTP